MNRELKLRGPLILCLFLLLAGIMLVVALNGYFTQANENNYRQSLSNALEQAALNVNDRMGSAVSAMRYMMYSNAMTTAVAIQEENITMSYQLQEIKDLRALVQSALAEKGTVELDEERKAAMVSNLLVVLCGNHDAQPVVNSGSLY